MGALELRVTVFWRDILCVAAVAEDEVVVSVREM